MRIPKYGFQRRDLFTPQLLARQLVRQVRRCTTYPPAARVAAVRLTLLVDKTADYNSTMYATSRGRGILPVAIP